jgi:hypothetical protein
MKSVIAGPDTEVRNLGFGSQKARASKTMTLNANHALLNTPNISAVTPDPSSSSPFFRPEALTPDAASL